MKKLATLVAIAIMSLCTQQAIAGADEIPAFDVSKSCRTDVQAYPTGGGDATCVADEQKAREVLISQWTQFGPESRANCVQASTDIAGAKSYVELLTCLQMAKDVKSLPK
jgi:hypothetical protein